MAKRRNKKKSINQPRRQTKLRLRSDPLDAFLKPSSVNSFFKNYLLPVVEEAYKSPPVNTRAPAPFDNVAVSPSRSIETAKTYIQKEKTPLTFCQSRAQRREVIHALGHAGKSGQKKPDNSTRNIKCEG